MSRTIEAPTGRLAERSRRQFATATQAGDAQAEAQLRAEVREFLKDQLGLDYQPGLGLAGPHDPQFSAALAVRGWVGMSIPKEYGGHGTTHVRRFITTEELLAAGAPIGAHWIADRQIAPAILRYGNEVQRRRFLPAIAAGRCYFSLGMSEPDSGSDLASIRTTAKRTDHGWELNGTKVWTSNAHVNDFVMVLARTAVSQDRHEGLSQFIVDLRASGVRISPIIFLNGSHHFNEVVFTNTAVPDDMLLGVEGNGWAQATSELSHERSAPDRYLSTFPVLSAYLREQLNANPGTEFSRIMGGVVARLRAIRQLALAIARQLDRGEDVASQAALAKDVGTLFEQEIIEALRQMHEIMREYSDREPSDTYRSLFNEALMTSPGFTLRGGTTEILRSVAARGLD